MKDKKFSFSKKSSRSISLHGDTGISEKEIGIPGANPKRLRGGIGIPFDTQMFFKILACAFLLILFALLQTTLFARFRPFGAVPDLILPLVVAVAMSEKEKFGAIFGVIAAFVIDSLGGATISILPLLYMPVGYICGILTRCYFRESIAVRGMYLVSTTFIRALFTAFTVIATAGGVTFISMLTDAVFPELIANLVFGFIPHVTAFLILRPLNRSREERFK